MARFRAAEIKASVAAVELGVSRSRFYALYSSYLRACAKRRSAHWHPALSGGRNRAPWPEDVVVLLRKLLAARPAASYSFAASEALRRFDFSISRATVRRFALRHGLAPDTRYKTRSKPVRRWQVARIGQLWQYDASPHRWFPNQNTQPVLLEIIDDHSRLVPAAVLYRTENLLSHFDLLSRAFLSHGLPLALYVDYHSFFFTHNPDSLTQIGAALRFYDISLRYAPTPQAKGKIERLHDYWQKRLPALFAAEKVSSFEQANALLDQLRLHRNTREVHREIASTPQAAWNLALHHAHSCLRPAPRCPWWPFVFSVRSQTRVGPDQRVAVGSLRLRIDRPPSSIVTRCLHPDGSVSILAEAPNKLRRPLILLRSVASS